MLHMEKSIKINCAPEKAFAFATDFSKTAEWQPGVVEAKILSEGVPHVGSTFLWVQKFMGQNMEMKCELTAWNPSTQYAYKGISSPFPISGGMTFKAQDGGVLVTLFSEAEPGGFFKLAEGMMKGQMDKQLDDSLQALKKALEG